MSTRGSILVVDETATSLKLLTDLLVAEGYDARAADSGERALAAVAARAPELILLDLHRPGLDGMEVFRRLKTRPESRDIPVVFVSSSGDIADRVESLRAGAVDYLSKPINRDELLARVKSQLELRRLQRQSAQQADDLRRANEQLERELAERQAFAATVVSLNQQAEASRLSALELMDEAVEAKIQLESAIQELRREIAERGQADAALRESEAHYRAVMESANDAIISSDGAGIIRDWNSAAERLFGYSESEATGRPVAMLVPEHLRDRHLQGIQQRRNGPSSSLLGLRMELEGRRKDGREFPIELSISEWSTPAGRHFTGVIHDITARRRAEADKATLEAQYRQAQKMESIGRLAGGVAHDFNNMLAIINGYTDLVMMKLDPASPMYADLQEVTKAAKRSAELVRQLLAFARKQTIAPRILDLNEAVANMLKLLERLIGEDINLIWKPGSTLWPIKMDPAQIDQILANLAVNARDAIAGTGKLTIESSTTIFDDAYCAAHPGSVPGNYVLLSVSDDGCGIDKEVQGQIFEPFFTTKAQGHGTGLGLSTVYGIVKQNLGFINVVSEPGRGTTFSIYLPAYASVQEAEAAPPPSIGAAMGSEVVLLVEDEEALLELSRRTLEHLGYTVLATTSPTHAIELFESYPGEIHLLLTDVVMPEMSGQALERRLTELRPTLKCLFTSAYTADVIADRGVLNEEVHFLQKPYTWQALSDKVRDALGTDK